LSKNSLKIYDEEGSNDYELVIDIKSISNEKLDLNYKKCNFSFSVFSFFENGNEMYDGEFCIYSQKSEELYSLIELMKAKEINNFVEQKYGSTPNKNVKPPNIYNYNQDNQISKVISSIKAHKESDSFSSSIISSAYLNKTLKKEDLNLQSYQDVIFK